MLKRVITIFSPPIFPDDEDKTRKAKYANAIAIAFLLVAIAFEAVVRVFADYRNLSVLDLMLFVVAVVCATGLTLLRGGRVRLASILLVVLIWVASNSLAATGYGARDSSYLINFAIILMAALLLDWQAALLVTFLTVLSGFALAYAEDYGWINAASYPITAFARDITFVFLLNGVLIYLLINGLENALKRSRISLRELASSNADLSYTQNELQTRTAELTDANEQLESSTQKLRAIAVITRTAASIQEFDRLVSSITSIISKELGYYQVSLFLLDEQREFAILRSTNTEDGLRILNQGYRVPVRQLDPIGFVAQTGQPRIVSFERGREVDSDNPDLPESRAEIVLPLRFGNQIIGILDIHSTEANGFQEEEIPTLSILADQLAITIQNSFLHEQSLRDLRKAEVESRRAAVEAWEGYEKSIRTKGYYYDGIKSEPLQDGKQASKGNRLLSIPVELRGQTIGRFKLNLGDPAREWTEDELVMVKAAAERVALALEATRLLEEAQKRAEREAFLSDVATKLSSSFQLDSILRDTVQELGQTLKNSTVTFQLVNPAELDAVQMKQTNGISATPKDIGAGND